MKTWNCILLCTLQRPVVWQEPFSNMVLPWVLNYNMQWKPSGWITQYCFILLGECPYYEVAIFGGVSARKKVKQLSAKSYCRVRLRLWNGSVVHLKSLFIGAFSQGVEKSSEFVGKEFWWTSHGRSWVGTPFCLSAHMQTKLSGTGHSQTI